jgi:CopG family nickel-responsive transcriptional regulator
MPIVSISLNDEILSELDKLQTSMGFSGRSEAIRAGIRAFVSEEKQKADLAGIMMSLIM